VCHQCYDPCAVCQVGLIAINLIGEAVDEHAPFGADDKSPAHHAGGKESPYFVTFQLYFVTSSVTS
jgi:hypothetical protein